MEPAAPTRDGRRLRVIRAVEVADCSHLIETAVAGTLLRPKSLRADVIDPKVSVLSDRPPLNSTGDGSLAEFASIVDTARCAIEVR